jgi:uncharacterized membrane protein (DUF106 family)
MPFTDLLVANPRVSIVIIALIVSFFVTLVNYFVLDKDKLRAIKVRQKELQAEMKNHKDNPTKMMELQKELMGHTMEAMKHSMKPMLITWIPIILFFGWIRSVFGAEWTALIWYYLIASLVGSLIFRKLFKLP